MKTDELLNKIKTFSGTTSSEMTIVFVILIGLIAGEIIGILDNKSYNDSKVNPEVFRILDSLAEQAKTTYTGTDIANNPLITENKVIGDFSQKSDSETVEIINSGQEIKSSKADKMKGILLNLNSASKVELMKLPGIGEKTAIAILEYRKIHPFGKISEIKNIKGIGDKKFESMKEFIEVK